MNLIALEASVSVVDRGSIVAAAAGLDLTPSAVTRRIQNWKMRSARHCLTAIPGPCSARALDRGTYGATFRRK
jgi:hypothetical protein